MSQSKITTATPPASTDLAPVVVIVPKDDEFRETCMAFGVDQHSVATFLEGASEVEYFSVVLAGHRVAVTCMDGQGNDRSQSFAARMIAKFALNFICLTGTALGNPAYSNVGAVFASRQVLGLTQIRQTPHGPRYQDVVPTDAAKAVLRDLRDHFDDPESITAIRSAIGKRAEELHLSVDAERYTFGSEIIGSGNEYFKSSSEHVEAQLWDPFPSARAYDMESWGVIQAAERDRVDWMTFRGVSDFGVQGGMSEEQRKLAAYASAAVLRSFLESPRDRMQEREGARRVERDELPNDNFYVQHSSSVQSFQERIGRDLGVELSDDVLDRALTPSDLIEVLVKAGADRETATILLPVVREEYFRDKYLHYHYRNEVTGQAVDSRALSRDWAKSIRDAMAEFGLNTLFGKCAIDVGCGNGDELGPLLFDAREASEIILIDLAKEFLKIAASRLPDGICVTLQTPAALLVNIPDHSADLYMSLRTYQSRMFDIDGAFREAYRVTKVGGLVAISISNGYASDVIDRDGRHREVFVPGLKASGMDRTLSQSAPYALADRLRRLYSKFGMSTRLFDLPHGELLVCGRVGEAYAADYYGA